MWYNRQNENGGETVEREILLLGDPRLNETSLPVAREELEEMMLVVTDLRDTLYSFRRRYFVGRAIAAPQIGVPKRLIYMEAGPVNGALFNPRLTFPDGEKMELLDDCMSFPNLLVRVERYRRCVVDYLDQDWRPRRLELEGDLSELIQHEYDHLDGVLATMRAADGRAFSIRPGAQEVGAAVGATAGTASAAASGASIGVVSGAAGAASGTPEGGSIRYKHTNLIANNWRRLSGFYQRALGLQSIGQTRDISENWLERMTGIPGAHIRGEHLKLPGVEQTLEIFGYDEVLPGVQALNRAGFSHIAFEVDDVEQALHRVLAEGGGQAGEVVKASYPGGVTATFVYAADPEGNLIELQNFRR